MTFGVCDFSPLVFTDWRLRRWRLCFLALMTATQLLTFIFKNNQITLFPFQLHAQNRYETTDNRE